MEHPDLEDYLNSKLLIFQQARSACICLDCDHVERVRAAAAACPRVVTFSQKFPSADVYGSQVRKEGEKIAFHVRTPAMSGSWPFPHRACSMWKTPWPPWRWRRPTVSLPTWWPTDWCGPSCPAAWSTTSAPTGRFR
ncbi:MAG: hypothetical protein ACLRNQ_18935 [Flavonifractor plautii]